MSLTLRRVYRLRLVFGVWFAATKPNGPQDSMSAAFGAGDMTSANNGGGGGGGGASNVSGVLGNTISLDEIMRATKTNVRRKTGWLCSGLVWSDTGALERVPSRVR